jgi:TrmH family RNA methyltransferase
MERITSRSNPLITHLRKLAASASYRREQGQFLCDGYKLLQEAQAWDADIITVVAQEGAECPAFGSGVRRVQVPPDVLASAAPSQTPQGVLFV